MTAGGENAGLHRKWLERKLEIEVGKVQAKLLSKGLSVPIPDAETLEASVRQVQSHLPKLCVELYGRNLNGTIKAPPEQPRGVGGPLTVVQKLDRQLNPALLTPIPDDVAAAYGLPILCSSNAFYPTISGCLDNPGRGSPGSPLSPAGGGGGGNRATVVQLPMHQMAVATAAGTLTATATLARHSAVHNGAGGALALAHAPYGGGAGGTINGGTINGGTINGGTVTASGAHTSVSGGASGLDPSGNGPPPRTARTTAPANANWRPDLQGADARIDEALDAVQRIVMQANEMSPRERVIFLARQVNPHFTLVHPNSRTGHSDLRSWRDLGGKSSKKVTSFSADPRSAAGSGRQAGSITHRSYSEVEGRSRSRDSITAASTTTTPRGPSSSGGAASDGTLPPLGPRSRSWGRPGSISGGAAAEAADHPHVSPGFAAAAAAAVTSDTDAEDLPPLASQQSDGDAAAAAASRVSGELDGNGPSGSSSLSLPRLSLPSTHSSGQAPAGAGGGGGKGPPARSVSFARQPGCTTALWGAAVEVHATEVAAAAAAREAEEAALAGEEAPLEAAAEEEGDAQVEAAEGAVGAAGTAATLEAEASAPRPQAQAEGCGPRATRAPSGGEADGEPAAVRFRKGRGAPQQEGARHSPPLLVEDIEADGQEVQRAGRAGVAGGPSWVP